MTKSEIKENFYAEFKIYKAMIISIMRKDNTRKPSLK